MPQRVLYSLLNNNVKDLIQYLEADMIPRRSIKLFGANSISPE